MIGFRMEITKEDSLRYISHLDYASLLQRAIRRAKLPAAYSEGFNPHMKLSFASALAVGVTTDKEYADLELTQDITQPDFFNRLSATLPEGIRLLQVRELSKEHHQSLTAMADTAVYDIMLPEQIDSKAVQNAVTGFNETDSAVVIRQRAGRGRKKGQILKRQINIKDFLLKPLEYNAAIKIITATVKVSSEGSVKPIEILTFLKENYIPTLDPLAALINRKKLLGNDKNLIE